MSSLRFALVACLLLCLGSIEAAAQGPANGRDPITTDAPVTSVDLAHTAKRPAATTQDSGSRFPATNPPGPASPNEEVWFLYTSDGRQVLQAGDADIPNCTDPFATDDCDTDATHVAVARQGDRMAVASVVDAARSELLFITDTNGDIDQETLLGAIRDLAISDNGDVVVAVTALTAAQGGGGRVYLFNWTGTNPWTTTIASAPTRLALSPDGASFSVAAGPTHIRFARGSPASQAADATFPGTVQDVAIANAGRHLSVAGSNEGWFVVYHDQTGANRREFRSRDSTTALTAVAIRVDGSAIAVGTQAGDVIVYNIDPTLPVLGTVLGRSTAGAALTDLRFSADGQHLLATTALAATQFGLNTTGVFPLWTQTQSGLLADGGISGDGEMVVLGAGSSVLAFDAKHEVRVVTPAAPTLEPGKVSTITVRVENAGNRLERATLTTAAPAGWNVTLSKTVVGVAPGQGLDVVLTVDVPANAAPGASSIAIRHDLGRGAGQVATPVAVNVPEVRRLVADADGSSKNIRAGETKAFEVDIVNTGNVAATPAVTASASPTGWKAVVGAVAEIAPGAKGTVNVDVTAPASAKEGDAGKVFVAVAGANTVELRATVGARFAFELTVPANGVFTTPGGTAQALLTLHNSGNAADSYTLAVTGLPAGYTARFPSGNATHQLELIEPGLSATFALNIGVPAGADPEAPPVSIVVVAVSDADPTQRANRPLTVSLEEEPAGTPIKKPGSNGSPLPMWPSLLALAAVAAVLRRKQAKAP